MVSTPPALHFDINAAVVFRLGEELITDVVQALVELVKNSYDADATWVKVTIDTQAGNKWGRNYPTATGAILVEDNGDGMDLPTIERGWLTIANSPKRERKAAGRTTARGRTPIGDKGLGRLGSQRLASNVEIITRPRSEPTTEHYVGFSWAGFRQTASIPQVPVAWQQSAASESGHGTELILSDLCEPKMWQSEKYLQDLQRKLSGMISPYEKARDFRVHLEVDGKRIELTEIAERVRETAPLRYTFGFDGEVFRISGVVRLTYLQPNEKNDRHFFQSLCRRDGGAALYEFLATKARKRRPLHFQRSKRPEWFVEFGTQQTLDDLGGVRRVDNSVANPGPFRGEVDAVSLDSPDLKSGVFDRKSDYRRFVRELAGIRVYRDGFGIRVGEDWLGLGKQWTRGSSYYGLRPGNVLGYVALSGRDNPKLVETTSREGFQVTPHYANFVYLLSTFVRFTLNAQGYLRRGVLQFLNEHRDRHAGVEPEETHSKITQRIDDVAESLASQRRRVQDHGGTPRRVAAEVSKTLDDVRDELDGTSVKSGAVSSFLANLEGKLRVVSTSAAETEKMLHEVSVGLARASSDLKLMREVLDRRWETLNDEVSALYESISLGLTAEVLAHEIHNIADRLARRSSALLRKVNRSVRKVSIITYIEHVRSSIAAMRKQLAHLTPSLRYLREQRERIEVLAWAKELASFHNENLDRKRIEVVIVGVGSAGFALKMNKGKLTQVFDNLLLNAEYWLSEAIRAGSIENGEITIVVEPPTVRVMDNGRGIEESVEESIFDPFVTTKRIGEGRGLGLYVVNQLLDSESCGIMLLPDRNAQGRRYVFELDLSGAVSG